MYVEDKVSHRGPFPIEVTADQTLAELKKQIQNEFEIPVDYQKWILGKELVTDETSSLKDHNITTEGCPVFLYLVAPDPKLKTENAISQKTEAKVSASTSTTNPPTTSNVVKEEIRVNGTPITKSPNEDKIEKVRLNVQNLQNKLNEHKNDINKNDIVNQPAKVVGQSIATSQLKTVDSSSGNFSKAFNTNVQPDKSEEIRKVVTSKVDAKVDTPQNKIDHTPKIVNVIPKVAETNTKKEVLIPITIEQCLSKGVDKPNKISEKPRSIIEIHIDEKINPPAQEESSSSGTKPKLESSVSPKNVNIDKPSVQMASSSVIASNLKDEATATDIKVEVPSSKGNQNEQKASKTKEEDNDEYDTKTLKPPKEWECHLCTLLNPVSSNICAVCATVRLTQVHTPKKSAKKKAPQPAAGGFSRREEETYQQLVNLDNADVVENAAPFECLVCFLEIPPKEGITLRECLHQFCKACLAHTIEFSDEAEIKCPYRDDDYSCNIALQDREIKALVSPAIYEQHLAKSVAQAENKIDKSFHCKTPDCKGWCIFEDNVNEFRCPVCRKINCLTCQAIHSGLNCKQYQEKMNQESEIDDDARRTKKMLEEMVNKGEAIECPTCKVILMKKWGCDWLRCSMCKTEICWVTRGPRWGPAGKGDTTGGCQCGVNGVKCHPKCNYCH